MTSEPASSRLLSLAAVITTAMMFGMTYSLSAALIALDLAEMGLSDAAIGSNAAMHAVGVLAMAFLLPRIASAAGIRLTVVGSLLLAAVLMLLFPALRIVWVWFVLRAFLGAASESLFVLSETWLNSLSSEATRGRAMGAYTAALSVGFALGPLLLSLVGTDGALPYLLGAGLAAGAAAFVVWPKVEAPSFEPPSHGNPLHYLSLAPLAVAATALNAAVETSGLTFLPLYAVNLGWQEAEATQLMSCMMFGAILLQLPIGWLGDKMDRRRLAAILAGLAALGALAWPFALQSPWMTYALLFLWGGAFVGIYTIMLTIIGSQFSGSTLIGIYAGMGLLWGAGALLGPLLAGGAMQVSAHGLPLFVAVVCALFMGAALLFRK